MLRHFVHGNTFQPICGLKEDFAAFKWAVAALK